MKTITRNKVIQTQEIETIYGCDNCDFEAETKENVKLHEFSVHQMKAKADVCGKDFYWLDNEKDMHNLVENGLCYESQRCEGDFGEPGWYGVDFYDATDSSYYYDEIAAEVKPIQYFIDCWNNDIEHANHLLHDAYELLKESK